jgi:hypothetical protein
MNKSGVTELLLLFQIQAVLNSNSNLIGVLEFDSRRGLGIFLFTTASITALVPTQPPIQWVPGTLSLEVKRPGLEGDHSPPFSADVKECFDLCLYSHNTPSWCGAFSSAEIPA